MGQGDEPRAVGSFALLALLASGVSAQRLFRLTCDFEKRSATPFYEIRAQGRKIQSDATTDARTTQDAQTKTAHGWSSFEEAAGVGQPFDRRTQESESGIQNRSALIASFKAASAQTF